MNEHYLIVKIAHKKLAEDLERKGDLRSAEEQFMLAGEWAAAMGMYEQAEQWADAHRLAKSHGGDRAHKQANIQFKGHFVILFN
jgi:intraflagellar transport protein 172